jgi:hypothetical protein
MCGWSKPPQPSTCETDREQPMNAAAWPARAGGGAIAAAARGAAVARLDVVDVPADVVLDVLLRHRAALRDLRVVAPEPSHGW